MSVRRVGSILLLCALAAWPASPRAVPQPGETTLLVTTAADAGPGSLREAIARANASPRPQVIRFDSVRGPFASPQTIALRTELPALQREVLIDGYIEGKLWQASGVTLSGGGKRRVLRIAPGARVTIASLTVADGAAELGAGILNEGALVVKGVTFERNRAARSGGGLASAGGALTVLNSTFAGNEAGESGGGLAQLGGAATVTHCTFARNRAPRGAGLYGAGRPLVRNTVLAHGAGGPDCLAPGGVDPRSTHNLFASGEGCGTPLSAADPMLGPFGAYNGPTKTFPLGGGSPGTNMADNRAALDEHGQPLAWDQRGNGDPRVVAGFADVGAFEVQAFPTLTVNTPEDAALRGCSGTGGRDCSLRGAIELANAAGKPATIRFAPQAFARPAVLTLATPLPEATQDLTLDAGPAGGIVVRGPAPVLRAARGRTLRLQGVRLETRR